MIQISNELYDKLEDYLANQLGQLNEQFDRVLKEVTEFGFSSNTSADDLIIRQQSILAERTDAYQLYDEFTAAASNAPEGFKPDPEVLPADENVKKLEKMVEKTAPDPEGAPAPSLDEVEEKYKDWDWSEHEKLERLEVAEEYMAAGMGTNDIAAIVHITVNEISTMRRKYFPETLKKPIDKGKIRALAAAGWTAKAIAEDVRCGVSTVYKVLNNNYEKEEA